MFLVILLNILFTNTLHLIYIGMLWWSVRTYDQCIPFEPVLSDWVQKMRAEEENKKEENKTKEKVPKG